MRNKISVRIKDQGSSQSCWTFSTLSMLETNLVLQNNEYWDFSERHMNYTTSKTFRDGINMLGYNREVQEGGNPLIAMRIYNKWQRTYFGN